MLLSSIWLRRKLISSARGEATEDGFDLFLAQSSARLRSGLLLGRTHNVDDVIVLVGWIDNNA